MDAEAEALLECQETHSWRTLHGISQFRAERPQDEHTVTRSTPDSGAEYVFTGTVSRAYLRLYLYLHTPRWRCPVCRSQLARNAPPLRFVAKYSTSAPSCPESSTVTVGSAIRFPRRTER